MSPFGTFRMPSGSEDVRLSGANQTSAIPSQNDAIDPKRTIARPLRQQGVSYGHCQRGNSPEGYTPRRSGRRIAAGQKLIRHHDKWTSAGMLIWIKAALH